VRCGAPINVSDVLGSLWELMLESKRNAKQITHRTRIGLNIHTPFVRIKVERLESTFAAENLEFVDVLVTTIVAGGWKTF